MARFALVDSDGVVRNVIVASPEWIRDEMPAWMRQQYAQIIEVVRDGEEPSTSDAMPARDVEPGARIVARDKDEVIIERVAQLGDFSPTERAIVELRAEIKELRAQLPRADGSAPDSRDR